MGRLNWRRWWLLLLVLLLLINSFIIMAFFKINNRLRGRVDSLLWRFKLLRCSKINNILGISHNNLALVVSSIDFIFWNNRRYIYYLVLTPILIIILGTDRRRRYILPLVLIIQLLLLHSIGHNTAIPWVSHGSTAIIININIIIIIIILINWYYITSSHASCE